MKRIFLFLLTNLAVIAVLSIVARLTGLDVWLAAHNQNLGGLLVLAAFFGFGGSFISLAMSKWMAKRAMGVQVIDPSTTDPDRRWLLSVVAQHARTLGVDMPEVGIFDSRHPTPSPRGRAATRHWSR